MTLSECLPLEYEYEHTVNDSSVDFGVLAEQVMGGNDKSVNNE